MRYEHMTVRIVAVLLGLMVSFFSLAQTTSWHYEFNEQEMPQSWQWLHETEGWPNKVKNHSVENGVLIIEPGTSGWFADKNAPFLFTLVKGDFDVRARVLASGLHNRLPETVWSLGGLMVRVPKNTNKDEWKPKEENWLFLTTGVAEETGKRVVETKYTINSKSNLKLRDVEDGWITLRIVRVGNSFILLTKLDEDKSWTVRDRYYIADLPPVLQVGINAYTNSMAVPPQILWGDPFAFNNQTFDELGKPDFRLLVDYITCQPAAVSFKSENPGSQWLKNVYENRLTDSQLSDKSLIKLLGE